MLADDDQNDALLKVEVVLESSMLVRDNVMPDSSQLISGFLPLAVEHAKTKMPGGAEGLIQFIESGGLSLQTVKERGEKARA